MAFIISKIKTNKMNFYAFDSFRGLPDLTTCGGVDNIKENKNYIPFNLKTNEKDFDRLIKKNISRRKILKIKGFTKIT